MKRRDFIAAVGMTLGAARTRSVSAADEAAAIQQLIKIATPSSTRNETNTNIGHF